jgi:hypothetical protein
MKNDRFQNSDLGIGLLFAELELPIEGFSELRREKSGRFIGNSSPSAIVARA